MFQCDLGNDKVFYFKREMIFVSFKDECTKRMFMRGQVQLVCLYSGCLFEIERVFISVDWCNMLSLCRVLVIFSFFKGVYYELFGVLQVYQFEIREEIIYFGGNV